MSITDAAGGFHFEPAALAKAQRLRLGGAPVAAADVAWLAGGPAPRVIATRLVALRARVGVPGAVVHVRAGGNADVATAVAGPDGVATLASLAAAPYELWAETSGQASIMVRVDAAAGDAEVGLTLAAASRVVGKLGGPRPRRRRGWRPDRAARPARRRARCPCRRARARGRWRRPAPTYGPRPRSSA